MKSALNGGMQHSRVSTFLLLLCLMTQMNSAHAAVAQSMLDADPELSTLLRESSTEDADLFHLMEMETPEETAAKEYDIDDSAENAANFEYDLNKNSSSPEPFVRNRWEDALSYTPAGGMVAEKRSCMNFVEEDGDLGPFAGPIKKYILGAQGRSDYGNLFLRDDLVGFQLTDKDSVCRNWAFFNPELRIKFWVWTFAAIGNQESDCKLLKGKTKGTRRKNGTYRHCAGITQMNWEKQDRYWRGENCEVSTSEILTLKGNLYCALDIMAEGLLGRKGMYEGDGRIWGPAAHSYWEELRKVRGGKIGRNIRAFKPCSDASLLPRKTPVKAIGQKPRHL